MAEATKVVVTVDSEDKKYAVASDLVGLLKPIGDFKPDPENARLHPDKNLRAIKDSLRLFGQDQPIVVQAPEMIVRKGNGRLEAALALGWTHIAAVLITEEQRQAVKRALADNRSAELAEWDFEVLAKHIKELVDDEGFESVEELGWEEFEASPMIEAEWEPPAMIPDESHEDGPSGAGRASTHSVNFTEEVYELVKEGLEKHRTETARPNASPASFLERLVKEYLA